MHEEPVNVMTSHKITSKANMHDETKNVIFSLSQLIHTNSCLIPPVLDNKQTHDWNN